MTRATRRARLPTPQFELFSDQNAAQTAGFKQRIPFVLYYQTSVAGLSVGSPVQLYGLTIGNVTDVSLEFDPTTAAARVRVAIEVQPERFMAIAGSTQDTPLVVAQRLVDRGMRVELTTLSYLTGQLAVSLNFQSGLPPAKVAMEGDSVVLPTSGGGGFSDITSALANVASAIQQVPLASIGGHLDQLLVSVNGVAGGPELKESLRQLQGTLAEVQDLVKHTDTGLTPLLRRLPEVSNDLQQTLAHANTLVASVDSGYGGNSQFSRDLDRLLGQFNDAARSIRLLTDFLDRHPEALIRGRANEGAER